MQTNSPRPPRSQSSALVPQAAGAFPSRGQCALVTGASSGLGEAFARALAARGMDLVLVARSEDKLRALAAALSAEHGVRADVVALDLGREGAAQQLYGHCRERGLRVDLLVNNAGFGTHGTLESLPYARQHAQVMLNVTSLVDASHLFLPDMLARGMGGIINVASTAGFQPVPYMAIYGASKAFVLSFTEALWEENRGRGVRVLALCPGSMETPFFDVVGTRQVAVGSMSTAEQVVRAALRALEQGRPSLVPGWRNWLQANLARFLPRALVLRVSAGMMRPRPLAPTGADPAGLAG